MGEVIAIKQYGERRTGTNYLRALLLMNSGVPVFMHVLGDKHAAPVDFATHWGNSLREGDPVSHFVNSTTWAAPAETTDRNDPAQLAYLRHAAKLLTHRFEPEDLRFIVSVKHPYAWAVSLARYSRWLDARNAEGETTLGIAHRNSLEAACRLYNERHLAWLRLREAAPTRTIVLRYEKLLEAPGAILNILARKFKLASSSSNPILIRNRTAPTHWDHYPVNFEQACFNPKPYRDRSYRTSLSEEMWTVVRETIDWSLAAEFGYRENHFHRTWPLFSWLALRAG